MIIVSYDISDNKLRTRFSKMLEKNGAVRLQLSVYEINHTVRHLTNIRLLIDNEYSKKFAPTDSVIIINVDNEKVTKYGYAIHWDKDISFY